MGIASSPLRDRLVFLVGARRSGTNWVQRVLAAHPAIVAIPSETHLLSHGIAPLTERFHHGAMTSPKTAVVWMDRADMHDALRDLCDRVFGGLAARLDPAAPLILERTPWHVYHLELIAAIYPDARVVHALRDGRDVARSLVSQPWGPSTVQEAAEEWRSSVAAARAAAPALGDQFREVRYEQLLADPASGVTELYSWLGVASDDDVVRGALVEAGVRFNTDARDGRVGEGKWRSSWSATEARAFDRVAGDLLAEVGYAREEPPRWSAADASALARSSVGRARSTIAARRAKSAPSQPDPHAPLDPTYKPVGEMERLQQLLDRVVAAVEGDAEPDWDGVLRPDARIRVRTATTSWEARGEDGRRQLADVLKADAATRVRPVRSEVYPAPVQSMVVSTWEDAAGARSDRVVVVGVKGDLVDHLAWYRFPLDTD